MKYVLLVLKRIKLKVFEMPVISYTESEFFGAEYISKAIYTIKQINDVLNFLFEE